MQFLDKQNSLSFQNITQTMKINKSKKEGLCYYHSDKPAKYRDRQSDVLYCTSCAIQQASKGGLIEDFNRRNGQGSQIASFLTEMYEQSQAEIHQYIRCYNNSYQRLIETLTDIQIKDILAFNKKIEENHSIYQSMRENIQNWKKEDLRNIFTSADHKSIIEKINQLNKTVQSFKINTQHSSKIKERLSPKIIGKHQSDFAKSKEFNISNKSLQENVFVSKNSSRQSFNVSSNNTNSLKSKTSSTFEQIKKSVYQDTPESIKFRTSDNSFKVTGEMAVTMFEKIDVCESIDISHKSSKEAGEMGSMESGEGRSSFSSLKSRYRYQQAEVQ